MRERNGRPGRRHGRGQSGQPTRPRPRRRPRSRPTQASSSSVTQLGRQWTPHSLRRRRGIAAVSDGAWPELRSTDSFRCSRAGLQTPRQAHAQVRQRSSGLNSSRNGRPGLIMHCRNWLDSRPRRADHGTGKRSTNGPADNEFDRPRRRGRWIRRGRRHGHQGAGRPRRLGAAAGGRADAEHGGPQGAHVAVSGAASRRRRARARPTPAGRPASPTARPTAARSSRASRTPSRPAATSRGSARAFSAAAPTTTAASRCASPTTTSSRRSTDGLGFDWPISYEDLAPYYDKAERFIGVTGTVERHPQRARRHLQPAGARCARTTR